MEPKIVEKDQIVLVGFSFFGDPFQGSGSWTEENEIARLRQRFVVYMAGHSHRIKHIRNAALFHEVHVVDEETVSKGRFEIFVGVEVGRLEVVPVEVLVKVLPPTEYAIFTFKGAQITADWYQMIYREWMPGSGYQEAHNYLFRLCDPRSGTKCLDEVVCDVYIPIQRSVR